MSGLAGSLTNDRLGDRSRESGPPGHAPISSSGLASPVDLMPPGSGLTIPTLSGAAAGYGGMPDEIAYAVLAESMISAGVADPSTWEIDGSPADFVSRAFDRFLLEHEGDSAARNFFTELSLAGRADPSAWYGEDSTDVPRRLYLSLHVESAGYVVLGPVLEALEREHPRMAATFYRLFADSLNRWVRVYDYRDALERVELLKEWTEQDPESGAEFEMPAVEQAIPECLRQRPLASRRLRKLLPAIRSLRLRAILKRTVELATIARRVPRPPGDEAAQQELMDANPPVPALLVVFQKHDAIEGCFDEEAQSMLEMPPEPNVIIPFDGTSPESVAGAFRAAACLVQTLALASELMEMLPGNERTEVRR
jgi:hypothetical protein